MNNGLIYKIFLSIILLVLGFSIGTLSIKSSLAQKTIQYKVINSKDWNASQMESNLNRLASEGWEYVGTATTSPPPIGDVLSVFKK